MLDQAAPETLGRRRGALDVDALRGRATDAVAQLLNARPSGRCRGRRRLESVR
jgi:hypothetical protein